MRVFVQPQTALSVLRRRAPDRLRRKTRDLVRNRKRAIPESHELVLPLVLLREISWIVVPSWVVMSEFGFSAQSRRPLRLSGEQASK